MPRDLCETGSNFATFIVFVVIAGMLYLGRDIFVPLALATLFSFALAPPMLWLRRYVGRAASAILVVALAFTVIAGFGTVVASQIASLAGNLPTYQYHLETKLHALVNGAGSNSVVERAASMLKSLRTEVEKPSDADKIESARAPKASPTGEQPPVPVIVLESAPGPVQIIRGVLGPMLAPLATTGIVVLLVIFMLLNRELLRDRFIRLAGAGNLGRTTEALDEAAYRVSRYLLMQLMVNAVYGLPIGIGLYLIGVPNAALWGGLAVVMRFVPYIGPWIAAVFPLALSIAVASGWDLFFWTAGLFLAVELVTGNVIEPWLYRSRTGLSSIAIVVAAVFWTWLWGFVGLLLSIPLTVCLVVVGRHVPRLEFLSILLGDKPALTPAQRFYQRLLAADPDEATEQAESFLKAQPIGAFYDEVVIPALALAQLDRDRGVLESDRLAVLTESASAVLENLEELDSAPVVPAHAEAPDDSASVPVRIPSVLCVAGGRELDRIAALYLVDLLRRDGFAPRVLQLDRGVATRGGFESAVDVVCLSYMKSNAAVQARYLVRRLRRGLPGATIVAGFWSQPTGYGQGTGGGLLAATEADAVATSLREAAEKIRKAVVAEVPAATSVSAPIGRRLEMSALPVAGAE